MKRTIITITLVLGLLLPIITFAAPKPNDYSTMNLEEALNQEEIDIAFNNYKENDNQVTIYLFRGNGCNYCRAFLTYLNSIADENGKFKVVSFEVWNDKDNNDLLDEVAKFLDQDIQGIPFIIIGDQVFQGYGETYNEEIEKAIDDEFQKSPNERYDVFEEMEKAEKEALRKEATKNIDIIIWNGVIVTIAMIIIIVFINSQNNKIHDRLDVLYEKFGIEIENENINKKSLVKIAKDSKDDDTELNDEDRDYEIKERTTKTKNKNKSKK